MFADPIINIQKTVIEYSMSQVLLQFPEIQMQEVSKNYIIMGTLESHTYF